jgi:D-lactate dehydrogenase
VPTRVAIYDVHPSEEADYRAGLAAPGYELMVTEQGLTPETAAMAAEAEVLSVHVSSPVTAEVMQAMPKLRHVACRSTGFDHVDRDYTAAHQISVSYVPSYGESTVAEYAFLLLMAATRKLMLSAHAVRFGGGDPEKLMGHDLDGKTIGVIGTGRIGRHAIRIARGFGLKVVAFDAYPNEAAARELGFEYHPLEQVLAQADYLTLHAPATPETKHLLSDATLAKVKPGVIIVNTARGSLIDTAALIRALEDGRVGAAALDVLEGEEFLQLSSEVSLLERPQITDEAKEILSIDILHKMPNVLITPHNAFNSAEARARIRATTIGNISGWQGGQPVNLIP